MFSKNSTPLSPTNVLSFLHLVENLKRTKRTGWVEHGIKGPESISDHMYRMSIMAMLVDDPALDRTRCIKMALVHDLAEAIVGDITPHAKVTKEEKYQMEKNAMTKICQSLGNDHSFVQEINLLWQEYEEATTPEALLVKDLDKFEMIVQALEYEKSDKTKLESFFQSTQGRFQHPQIRAWAEALYEERKAHHHSCS
ncbi:HD domain-containing protein 2 [Piptocephalis cylindrospora]|uniref:5'-deoxynucleotidase n=1 Tax=Piptocephalis cylindrospora TaxID=1907219 RepID=A0A4P9Y5R2_9FUNG|nr:HD domain-containing protein 2 [Piptocephalis cylindrospora]|eukprot:RKP14072.1 HD domain-containing protein 2 [Piptocephalis cylindrospora]